MGTWNSSPHPISDLRDWQRSGRLEIQPDFQRRSVWSQAARVMLMDTVLRGIPMPKILAAAVIRDGSTHRIIIDGQQRIRAILDYLDDKYALASPYSGEFFGCRFSELDVGVQRKILSYSIDFNEAIDFDELELREVYSRVNKYTVALNKQELRRADYPGDFLEISENLALSPFLERFGVFSVANRRRLADVEFSSELLCGLLDGPQEKKSTLDRFYLEYEVWPDVDKSERIREFEAVLEDIDKIFSGPLPALAETRFRQKADFYALFLAIAALRSEGLRLSEERLDPLRCDFEMLDWNISPSSSVMPLKEYAIRCVSDANSYSSRKWRRDFLKDILSGTYHSRPPSGESAKRYIQIRADLDYGDPMCRPSTCICPYCETEWEFGKEAERVLLGWSPGTKSFQVTNSAWVHESCHHQHQSWVVLEEGSPNDEGFLEVDSGDGDFEE